MKKTDLVQVIANSTGVTLKVAAETLNNLISYISEGIKSGDKVMLDQIGSFSLSRRKARAGVNPQKPNEKITIPAMNVVRFKTSQALKTKINS